MIKLYRKIKFFFTYRKNILKNLQYLSEKYGLVSNIWLELYTTITFVDAPPEMVQKYGKTALVEKELKEYITKLNSDLPKLELDELLNLYEIKKLDDNNYGIAFGYALANNTILILSALLFVIAVITGVALLIFI